MEKRPLTTVMECFLICYCCGSVKKFDLKDRVYTCDCGYTGDRDHNAAINILTEGLRILQSL